MRAFATWMGLSWRDRGCFARAWLLLIPATLSLRVLPYRRVARWFASRMQVAAPRTGLAPSRVVYLADAAAARFPLEVTCLPRSLVLQRLLRGEHHRAELRWGVRRVGESLDAHAWVEIEGQPIGEPADVHERFAALEPGPPAREES